MGKCLPHRSGVLTPELAADALRYPFLATASPSAPPVRRGRDSRTVQSCYCTSRTISVLASRPNPRWRPSLWDTIPRGRPRRRVRKLSSFVRSRAREVRATESHSLSCSSVAGPWEMAHRETQIASSRQMARGGHKQD